MPVLEIRQPNAHTIIGIWALTETIEELSAILPHHVKPDESLTQAHVKRQKEWLASRILVFKLLENFTGKPVPLYCNTQGKPVFEDDRYHVSISHASELVAVIVSSEHEVGIDVELVSPKALRVAHKFLTEEEQQQTGGEIEKTCLYWSAKETLYKLYSRKQLIFKENLLLKPSENNNMLWGSVKTDNFSKLYQVQFETVRNHILTYCIDISTNS